MNTMIIDEYQHEPIWNLALYFVQNITHKTVQIETRLNHAVQSIIRLLEKGWTLETIRKELDDFHSHYPMVVENIYHIEEIMGNKQPPNNLMDPDIFYYHNRLRITSKPSRLVLNKETREYERIEEPFFLEMTPCFTLEDLLEYWYRSNGVQPNENITKKDKGRFEYLLRFYDLDEILFAIDVAKSEREKLKIRPLTNAFNLEQYMEQAKEDIKLKQNTHKRAGINQVIPRREVV